MTLKNGLPAAQVLADLAELHTMDDPDADRPGLVNMYDTGMPGVERLATDAFGMYLHVNPLYSTTFPSVYDMEREVVRAATDLLHGGEAATGSWTSGGSESCLLAVKAARDGRPEVAKPRMILPISAHAAWWKGAHYLGVDTTVTPIDPHTFRADIDAIRDAIDENTVLVVLSAPQYGHGVIDPIAEVAALCLERGVRLHVDACIGGWVLPFMEQLGHTVRPWDFRVPGVSSISVDLQKYGYTTKGCSLVLYRDRELRRSQFFVHAGWTGYPIANSTVQSSKPGGLLAAGWSVMRHLGADGYLRLVEETLDLTRQVADGVDEIPGLIVLGRPESSLIAVTTVGIDFFAFLDELGSRGWAMQPQLSQPGIPPSIHFTMAAGHRKYLPSLLEALSQAAEAARARKPLLDIARIEMLRALPADIAPERLNELVQDSIVPGSDTASLHLVVDSLSVPLREAAIFAYFEGLTAPTTTTK
ncbi:MAG: lyase [Nocardia sp.]|uniref:pyridoxal phosphate-dependent decarboxylase family protein n=1 Tax=Nocardia sp. TaxID=1821 RepID=UPI00260DCF0C|nr:aspartate aminotransferase family protein [Nocardia sp.]MCU1642547.1 lyase [Nocardia sp.]